MSGELIGVAVFDSESSYRKNADDPKQDEWYRDLRQMLEADPEWSDGDVLVAMYKADSGSRDRPNISTQVLFRRYKAMAGVEARDFSSPDETRTPEKTRIELLSLGGGQIGRYTFQPGWRWSECIKPSSTPTAAKSSTSAT